MEQRGGPVYNQQRNARNQPYIEQIQPLQDESSDEERNANPFGRQPRVNHASDHDPHIKLEVPDFSGEEQPDEVLDWLEVERIFEFLDFPENKKVKMKLVAIKLKGYASSWWQQVQMTRVQSGKDKIQSWPKMQRMIRSQFLPLNYEGTLFQQYQSLRQGAHTVREYTNDFYKMKTRVQLAETEVQVIHRYLMGLKPSIRNFVELQPCWTLSSAVQLAMKVESQQRQPTSRYTQPGREHGQFNANPTQDSIGWKSSTAPKHMQNFGSATSLQGRGLGRGRGRGLGGNTVERNNSVQFVGGRIICYKCGKEGHKSSECRKLNSNLLVSGGIDDSNNIEEVPEDNDGEESLLEVAEDEVTYEVPNLPNLVVRRTMLTPKVTEGDWRCNNIFKTKCTSHGRLCNVIID